MREVRKVGEFTSSVVAALSLPIPVGTPIYIGLSNEEHIKARHPYEYDLYYPHISEIISSPNYVGMDSRNGSISFVKSFSFGGEYVQASVRVSGAGTYFVKTLISVMTYKAERFIARGTLVRV